jgi:hypothetical protein
MPPLWQYSSTAAKADETIPDPKGRESWTPKPFPLQKDRFQGTTKGGHDADLGPLCPAPLFAASLAVVVGEGHAPVVAGSHGTPPPGENDIEFGNITRAMSARSRPFTPSSVGLKTGVSSLLDSRRPLSGERAYSPPPLFQGSSSGP